MWRRAVIWVRKGDMFVRGPGSGTRGLFWVRSYVREREVILRVPVRRRSRRVWGPGRALLHGDPCPDNFLSTADGGRFVDFENAAWGDGLVELAYLRIGFPTCWCALAPEPSLVAAAEAEYRANWRSVTGTDLVGDVTDACAGWMLRGDGLVERASRGRADHLGRLLEEDWTWGVATAA